MVVDTVELFSNSSLLIDTSVLGILLLTYQTELYVWWAQWSMSGNRLKSKQRTFQEYSWFYQAVNNKWA